MMPVESMLYGVEKVVVTYFSTTQNENSVAIDDSIDDS